MIKGSEITPFNTVSDLLSPSPTLFWKEEVLCHRVSPAGPIPQFYVPPGNRHRLLFSISLQSWHLSLASSMCFGDSTQNLRLPQNPQASQMLHGLCAQQCLTDTLVLTSETAPGQLCLLRPSLQESDFQPFSPHGTHKLITKILRHTKKCILFFANLTKKVGIILIHSHWTI